LQRGGRQPVERRRDAGAKPIRAKRIDGDEQDVRLGSRRRIDRASAARRGQHRDENRK
jgi:hypothetical protein